MCRLRIHLRNQWVFNREPLLFARRVSSDPMSCSTGPVIRGHPMNCGIFINCSSGQPDMKFCPPNQFFDPSAGQCGDADRVLRKCQGEVLSTEAMMTEEFTTFSDQSDIVTHEPTINGQYLKLPLSSIDSVK